MIIFSGSKKFFAILALGFIILAVFIWLFILPLLNKIKIVSQKYLDNQEIILKFKDRNSAIKDLKENYPGEKNDLSEVKGAFLPKEEAVDFISTLETIAKRTNNIFDIQLAKPPAGKEKISSFDFRISLWGSFNNLLDFIANLENEPYPPYRLIGLENLTIKRLTDNDLETLEIGLAPGAIQSVLSVKIYIQ
ncbi:MAG: hypothetical protein A3H00_03055 [Candidatus Portnoybacteria bacterium RBG_13_40_8]|nr:MAG: hypothetical protein A3H00_03055 [Candidatus Portnoybacteria bacterium RBG_13_40_8]